VLPVNPSLRISGCRAMALPTSEPGTWDSLCQLPCVHAYFADLQPERYEVSDSLLSNGAVPYICKRLLYSAPI
jgi:hypothetical protein